jgi:PAS domain S-box-containing protein
VPFEGKGAVMVGLDGRIAWASTYFCDLVGVEHDKIAGMSCFDFVFPEDMEAAKARFEENKRPDAAPFRFRLRRVDGFEVWADIQGTAIRPARGEIYAISATVTAVESPEPLRGR